MILQAYVDDSASDDGERRLFLAGYINTADKWELFSEAWAEELKRAPSIDYLKMREANRLHGQFRGWLAEDRDEKLRDLSRIIRHFQPASIHASVSRSEVERIIKPVAPYGFSSPYFYCFQAVMIPLAISQYKARQDVKVPVDFIFDNQEGLGEDVKTLYKAIREEQPRHIRNLLSLEPVFRDDKQVLPLQAADMLAWHIRRHYERGDPDGFMVPDFLSADGLHMAVDITAADLTRIAEGFAPIPGTSIIRDKNTWRKMSADLQRLIASGFIPPRGTRWKNAVHRARIFLARFVNS